MAKRSLLIFIIYLLQSIGAFEIIKERVEVTKKGSDITVKIPYDSALKSVFLAVELSDQCTVGFKYIVNNNNSTEDLTYTQNVINELKENDVITLLGVFETKDEVIRKSLDYKIGVDGIGALQLQCTVPENEFNLSETCVNYKCTYRRRQSIFEEYFNESMSQWQNEVRTLWYSAVPFQESVVYTNERETCELKNGNLLLKAKWNTTQQSLRLSDCTSMVQSDKDKECGPFFLRVPSLIPSIFSAKVYSYPFKFKYGRVEIRVRFALGDWLMPYIMLQDRENMNINLGSHIRMYARGNLKLQDNNNNEIGAEILFGSAFLIHPSGNIEFKQSFRNKHATPLAYDFHNYTIIWRRDKILFKIDGMTFGSITNETILKELSTKERAIALGLTAGGGLNFPDNDILPEQKEFKNDQPNVATKFVETIMKNETQNTWTKPYMEIDYVKVFALDANEQ